MKTKNNEIEAVQCNICGQFWATNEEGKLSERDFPTTENISVLLTGCPKCLNSDKIQKNDN